MYGNKLWITGITMILAVAPLWPALPWEVIGAVIAIIGCILVWLDK